MNTNVNISKSQVVEGETRCWVKAEKTAIGAIDRSAVIMRWFNNQYVVVMPEGMTESFTVKKSEIRLLPESKTSLVVVPKKRTPYAFDSKKAFHLVFDPSSKIMGMNRPITKQAYVATKGSSLDSRRQFGAHETSNFFDLFSGSGFQYGEFSVFSGLTDQQTLQSVEYYETLGRRGWKNPMISNQTWTILYGDWDSSGSGVLVPHDSNVHTLEDMGIHLNMDNKNDALKVRKYFRRVKAHHEWAIPGTVIGTRVTSNGSVIRVEIEDDTIPLKFDVLHVDLDKMSKVNKSMADGICIISTSLLKYLGKKFGIAKLLKYREGMAFKGTMFSKLGLGKGFFHVRDMERFGIIVYGPKKQATFDKFFLGSLGDVKGGEANTDIQSLGAFIDEGVELWKDQAALFLDQTVKATKDEGAFRRMLLRYMVKLADKPKKEGVQEWVFVEALRRGIPLLKNPGLWRKGVRNLMQQTLQCERGRIPYGDSAYRYNLMPDPSCFDLETGEVDITKSILAEDCICCMDAAPGPFALYRQPLGNAKEAVVTTNMPDRRFNVYRGLSWIIFGASGPQYLATMGGADYDDSAVGVNEVDWIKVIENAEYPVQRLPEGKASVVFPLEENNRFLKRRAYPCAWSMKDYFDAATKATRQSLEIGPIDNAVRLDRLLSGPHKANMLRDLDRRIAEATTPEEKTLLQKAYVWLDARQDDQLRLLASNMEAIIDNIKLGKGDPAVFASLLDMVADVRDNSLVLPECWLTLSVAEDRKNGKVPLARFIAQDYVVAPSLVCETLKAITLDRDKALVGLRDMEWQMVEPIPRTLDRAFPRDASMRQIAFTLRSMWGEYWTPFIEKKTGGVDAAAWNKLVLEGGKARLSDNTIFEIQGIKPYIEEFDSHLDENWDPMIRMSLAVEIARQTYRTRYQEGEYGSDLKFRQFSDGLLWTNEIGNYYVAALEEAGLAGLYVPVKFDAASNKLSHLDIRVKVEAGNVTRKSDGFRIGYVVGDQIPEDGEYPMSSGLICVIHPHPELTERFDDINPDYNNPVVDGNDDQNWMEEGGPEPNFGLL